jgi:hypothetical protein
MPRHRTDHHATLSHTWAHVRMGMAWRRGQPRGRCHAVATCGADVEVIANRSSQNDAHCTQVKSIRHRRLPPTIFNPFTHDWPCVNPLPMGHWPCTTRGLCMTSRPSRTRITIHIRRHAPQPTLCRPQPHHRWLPSPSGDAESARHGSSSDDQ